MKKTYSIISLLAALSLPNKVFALAYCSYGRSPNGAVKFEFTKSGSPDRPFYMANLSPQLAVTVTKVQGHSARYTMTANYNKGQVIFSDMYVDFQPARTLYLSGSVEGEPLQCLFDPQEF